MMYETTAIQIQQVTKSFGKKVVLNHLNYDIQEGRIYGFIGPSGSGKTTLIKMMVGMDVPDQGAVTLLGEKMPNLHILQKVLYGTVGCTLYNANRKRKPRVFCIDFSFNKGRKAGTHTVRSKVGQFKRRFK